MISSFPVDSLNAVPCALPGGGVINEGPFFRQNHSPKQGYPYPSPIARSCRSLRLFQPVGAGYALHHVGISSIRVEPT